MDVLGFASDSESRPNWIGGERDPDQYTPLASCTHHRRIVDSSLLIYPASSPYSNTSVYSEAYSTTTDAAQLDKSLLPNPSDHHHTHHGRHPILGRQVREGRAQR